MVSKLALHSAPSMDSCDTQVAAAIDGPPSRKRKANTYDPMILGLKRSCDSPLDSCDASSYECSQTDQEWDSPAEDIDLSSNDSLDEELEFEADNKGAQVSPASSTQSEGWTFLVHGENKHGKMLELAGIEEDPKNMTSSPTKTGDFLPKSLPPHCLVAATAHQYGFTPLVISVGTTYFQRLAAADPRLKKAAQGCPDFAPFVAGIAELPAKVAKSVGAPLHQCQTTRHWLLAIHLTCIYIAAKNLEVVPYKHLLRTMLQRLHGPMITASHAEQLEIEVLVALDWRLGPFFLHRDP